MDESKKTKMRRRAGERKSWRKENECNDAEWTCMK